MRQSLPARLLLAFAALAALAAGSAAPAIPNGKVPIEGLLSGGQPTPEQLEEAAKAGYRTVINLRSDAEEADGFAWEAETAARLGLRYVRIPIAGPADLTRENVERLDRALAESQGPVLVHCASGNRNGALLALREAWIKGESPEKALAFGQAAGLTRLEATTRELLGLPPAEAPGQPQR